METLITFSKPILFEIPQLYRARIVAQLLIDELAFGTPHPVDDFGLYPVLAGDYLECVDYDALMALYQSPIRHLYLESITGNDEHEYTLHIQERDESVEGKQYVLTKHTLRYQAKHGAYELSRGDARYVTGRVSHAIESH